MLMPMPTLAVARTFSVGQKAAWLETLARVVAILAPERLLCVLNVGHVVNAKRAHPAVVSTTAAGVVGPVAAIGASTAAYVIVRRMRLWNKASRSRIKIGRRHWRIHSCGRTRPLCLAAPTESSGRERIKAARRVVVALAPAAATPRLLRLLLHWNPSARSATTAAVAVATSTSAATATNDEAPSRRPSVENRGAVVPVVPSGSANINAMLV